jgi:hypothetical protein
MERAATRGGFGLTEKFKRRSAESIKKLKSFRPKGPETQLPHDNIIFMSQIRSERAQEDVELNPATSLETSFSQVPESNPFDMNLADFMQQFSSFQSQEAAVSQPLIRVETFKASSIAKINTSYITARNEGKDTSNIQTSLSGEKGMFAKVRDYAVKFKDTFSQVGQQLTKAAGAMAAACAAHIHSNFGSKGLTSSFSTSVSGIESSNGQNISDILTSTNSGKDVSLSRLKQDNSLNSSKESRHCEKCHESPCACADAAAA